MDDFTTAMRRSLEQTRGGDPMSATETIRAVLGGGGTRPTRARRPLGDVVSGLAARARRRPAAPEPGPLPQGARFDRHRHSGPYGARDYRLYQPAPGTARRGVVVMLHGCTQGALDFAAGTRMNALAEREGLVVIWPEQTREANAQGCWNWFRPSDQAAGRGEPALLAGLVDEAVERAGAAGLPVHVAGLSAGAAMAVILGAAYPDRFESVGAHSGLARGAAHDVASAFAAMQGQSSGGAGPAHPVRTIVFQGDADRTVHPSNADAVARDAVSAARGAQVETVARGRSGGRSHSRRVTSDGSGRVLLEHWSVEGLGHAWSGGDPAGSYADPKGPDASAEMVRFFLEGA